jgi:DNA processing protein
VNKPKLKHLIALSLIPGVGSLTARQLIAGLGSAEAIFEESLDNLRKISGIGPWLAENIKKEDYLAVAEDVLEFNEKYKIREFSFLDDAYPKRLKECEDAPLVLYQKGEALKESQVLVSIVGTRNATEYGKHHCREIVAGLKERGIDPVIVSGLAYGIDACAHKAALEFGLQTIAVLGHGLDKIYPAQHKNLAKRIVESGSLMTEFGANTVTSRSNFKSRNRIVAGLSDLTIVVESAAKGGSLITADIAFSYDREVMAVPGRIGDDKSAGCNYLIKTNKASMLESVDDIIYQMNWDEGLAQKKSIQLDMFNQLTEEQRQLYDWLKEHKDSTIDDIVKHSGIDKSLIPSLLLDLEFTNLVKPMPGKIYKLI